MSSSILNHTTCVNCLFAPFCSMTKEGRHPSKQAASHLRQRSLKKNETLWLPKDKFKNLYVIHQGALKTYQVEADGKELIRGFYFASEMLGYETISTGYYLFTAISLSDTIVCEIPYDYFLKLLQSRPVLQKRILQVISQQLNAGAYLVLSSAEQRVAAFLIDLSMRLSFSETKMKIILPMSRQDIGNYLRLTAETISRLFSRLQKNKIIAINHKFIHLLQPEKLKQIADGLC